MTLASGPLKLKSNGLPTASEEDVDGDGALDIIVQIPTEALQLSETYVKAILEGQSFDGIPITGSDSVSVVP